MTLLPYGFSLIVSALITINLTARFLVSSDMARFQLFLASFGMLVLLSLLVYQIGYCFAWAYLQNDSIRAKNIAILFSLIVGLLIGEALPFRTIIPVHHSFEIIIKSQKEKGKRPQQGEVEILNTPYGGNYIYNRDHWNYNFIENKWSSPIMGETRKLIWAGHLFEPLDIRITNSSAEASVLLLYDGEKIDIFDQYAEPFRNSLIIKDFYEIAPSYYKYLNPFVRLGDVILLAFPAFVLISLAAGKRPDEITLESPKWIMFYALPMIIVWGIYLLAFWPGITINESESQWRQAHQLIDLNNTHPIMYTLAIRYITNIWDNLAAVLLVQILGLAFSAAYGFFTLHKLKVHQSLVGLGVLAMAILPINAFFVNHLLKDIPFAIALVLITTCLLNIYLTNGDWIDKWPNLVLLGAAMMLTFVRYNGPHEVVLIFLGTAIFYPKKLKPFGLVFAIVITGFLSLQSVARTARRFSDRQSNIYGLIMWHQLEGYVIKDIGLDQDELIQFNSMFPDLPNGMVYDCLSGNISFAKSYGYNKNPLNYFLDVNNLYLRTLFLKALIRNPLVAIEHVGCHSTVMWKLLLPAGTTQIRLTSNLYHTPEWEGTSGNSQIPEIEAKLFQMLQDTRKSNNSGNPTWLGPGVYFQIFLLGFFLRVIRVEKRIDIAVVTLPIFAHFVVLALSMEWPMTQLVYPMIPCMILLTPLMYSRNHLALYED